MSKPCEIREPQEEEPMYAAPIGPTRPGEAPMYIEVGMEYDVNEGEE